jgi:hypothetical protein
MEHALFSSPLEGEVPPKAAEGVGAAALDLEFPYSDTDATSTAARTPPPAFGRILPSRGRETGGAIS